ncbi:MAG: hypothetical protein ABF932_13935 [Gluconobacter potus]|uniref:hypothetical protein n=1 Tax=Gluconobacter potus TaxID=2724927 RepID=UPI0039EA64BE
MRRLTLHAHADNLVRSKIKSLISAILIHDDELTLPRNRQRAGRVLPPYPLLQNHLIAGLNFSRQLFSCPLVPKRLKRGEHEPVDTFDQKTRDQKTDNTINKRTPKSKMNQIPKNRRSNAQHDKSQRHKRFDFLCLLDTFENRIMGLRNGFLVCQYSFHILTPLDSFTLQSRITF